MNIKVALVMVRDLVFFLGAVAWWYVGSKVLILLGADIAAAAIWPVIAFTSVAGFMAIIAVGYEWFLSARGRTGTEGGEF